MATNLGPKIFRLTVAKADNHVARRHIAILPKVATALMYGSWTHAVTRVKMGIEEKVRSQTTKEE